jgi:uncharacterized lipoprotein YddW (UPF0748 family)
LAGWLKTEAGKSRKQRRKLKQIHADLVALGFTGTVKLTCRRSTCAIFQHDPSDP